MGFTEDEKVRIRHHLGFLNVSTAATFSLGTPANVQTQFIIEPAMDLVPVAAEKLARTLLDRLDVVDFQIFDDADTLVASRVGAIDLNPIEFEKILQRYNYIRGALANLLGVMPNPYDKRFYNPNGGGGMGINCPVTN